MSGIATSQMRSAYVAETTAGTTPATPAFITSHAAISMSAKPAIIEGRSLIANGARHGRGLKALDVTGKVAPSSLIYGVYDDMLATLLQSSWASDVMKDGKAETAVTVENEFAAGVGGASSMLRFRGVEATTGTINLAARQEAQISFELVGRGSDDATTTAITGATYTDPVEATPLSSGADVGTIVFDGYALDCMESLEIVFGYENRDLQPRISSNDLCGITRGDFLPVLNSNMYIEPNFMALYNAARAAHSKFSVTIPIGSVTGEKYTIVFPSCQFGEVDVDTTGVNIMQKVQILPQWDIPSAAVVTITRAVA